MTAYFLGTALLVAFVASCTIVVILSRRSHHRHACPCWLPVPRMPDCMSASPTLILSHRSGLPSHCFAVCHYDSRLAIVVIFLAFWVI